jgi:hypothetical protein
MLGWAGINVCVERDCVALKEAEIIQSTGKMENMMRSSAMINRMTILDCFWNFCEDRRS